MSARSLMIQRAQVERNAASGRDRNNQPAAPDWQPVPERIPCFLWSTGEHEVDGQTNGRLETVMLGVPVAADVSPADRIHGIYDRTGKLLDPHAFRITGDQLMAGSHRELTLEVLSSAVAAGS